MGNHGAQAEACHSATFLVNDHRLIVAGTCMVMVGVRTWKWKSRPDTCHADRMRDDDSSAEGEGRMVLQCL